MSLTSFINMDDVRAKLRVLHPKVSRRINVPCKVEPRSDRYALIGTAFDYLLRFEIQRRAPHAITGEWVAEHAADLLGKEEGNFATWVSLTEDGNGLVRPAQDESEMDDELSEKVCRYAHNVVENAKSTVAAYVVNELPTRQEQAEMAAHAIRLANLDPFLRELQLNSGFDEVNNDDVEELLDMLAIVPFNMLIGNGPLFLNPTFGASSRLVGGADADLITGNMLVDLKVKKRVEIRAKELDQLLGYFLLARNQERVSSDFPKINKVALYFSRHGFLWSLDTSAWTYNPQFLEIEEWFLKRAEQVFGRH